MPKTKPLPPLKELENLIHYAPETGVFRWKTNMNPNAKENSLAGCVHRRGYIVITVSGKKYQAHRLAWYLSTKDDPGSLQIDHINGDRSDNRISNLRTATNSQNQRNTGAKVNNTLGLKGVNFSKVVGKYHARIRIDGKRLHLGYFDTPELAHMAYCKAAAELHGDFARAA